MRRPTARRLSICGIVLSGIIVVAFVLSMPFTYGYLGDTFAVVCVAGQVDIVSPARCAHSGWYLEANEYELIFQGHPQTVAAGNYMTLSLLTPLLPVLAVTALCWRRSRRPPPGHCQECGYDLRGSPTGICSECGTEANA